MHRWTDADGNAWECDAYDHGPFCRRCRQVSHLRKKMAVLDCPMEDNDAEAATIREYLIALLLEIWQEGEGFSGKRPFGNSGWESDLYKALGAQGHITCELDEDGYLDHVDYKAGDRLIREAILTLR